MYIVELNNILSGGVSTHKYVRVSLSLQVLRFLSERQKREPEAYDDWYKEFHSFIKEGPSGGGRERGATPALTDVPCLISIPYFLSSVIVLSVCLSVRRAVHGQSVPGSTG